MQCKCELHYCKHEPGKCNGAAIPVTNFGVTRWFCEACIGNARASNALMDKMDAEANVPGRYGKKEEGN